MSTFMGRLWILGTFLGLLCGIYLATSAQGGITAIAIMPLLGAMAGILIAMFVAEARAKLRKKK